MRKSIYYKNIIKIKTKKIMCFNKIGKPNVIWFIFNNILFLPNGYNKKNYKYINIYQYF